MKFHHAIIAVCGIAHAEAVEAEPVGLSLPQATTELRAGPEIDFRIAPQLGLRAETTFRTIQQAWRAEPASGRLESGSAVADVYPFKRGFRASLGVRFYGNRAWAILRAAPGAQFLVGGRVYSAGQLRMQGANAGLAVVAPMLTVGYTARISRNLAFGVDGGALFRGSSNRPLQAACAETPCSAAMAALEAERGGMSRDIGRLQPFPLAQVRLGLRF